MFWPELLTLAVFWPAMTRSRLSLSTKSTTANGLRAGHKKISCVLRSQAEGGRPGKEDFRPWPLRH